jgi:undecaprenyl phosphate-alpha-L-ara4FN deformylase
MRLVLKVDVDTDRGTREGVPNLLADCQAAEAEACFLFSLGPDQTGRAITRVLRPGFFQKVSRTSVVQIYGVRTLLNGTLLPAPHIGLRNAAVMRRVREAGYEVGIHCHNHYRWQDYLERMSLAEVREEFVAARAEFLRIFGSEARTAGAPGWQSNAKSREVYDEAELLYASDTRGGGPFFPRIGGKVFRTLEIPSTLPTFDELMGRPEYPDDKIVAHYMNLAARSRAGRRCLRCTRRSRAWGGAGCFNNCWRRARRPVWNLCAWTTMRGSCWRTAQRFRCAIK